MRHPPPQGGPGPPGYPRPGPTRGYRVHSHSLLAPVGSAYSTCYFIVLVLKTVTDLPNANDIVLADLQFKFNNILVTMLSPQCTQRPMLKTKPGALNSELKEMVENAETCMEATSQFVAGFVLLPSLEHLLLTCNNLGICFYSV